MQCCYVLSDTETQYSTQVELCDCVKGNRNELISQIQSNPQFCRDETAISYNYFVTPTGKKNETKRSYNLYIL